MPFLWMSQWKYFFFQYSQSQKPRLRIFFWPKKLTFRTVWPAKKKCDITLAKETQLVWKLPTDRDYRLDLPVHHPFLPLVGQFYWGLARLGIEFNKRLGFRQFLTTIQFHEPKPPSPSRYIGVAGWLHLLPLGVQYILHACIYTVYSSLSFHENVFPWVTAGSENVHLIIQLFSSRALALALSLSQLLFIISVCRSVLFSTLC